MRKVSVYLLILILSFSLLTLLNPVQAAEIFSDGFESGDFSAWTGTTSNQSGQPTVQSTIKHHGTYAMQCALIQNGYQAYAFKDVSSGNTFYVRAYVRFNKYPTTGESYNYILMMCRASDDFGGLQVSIVSDGEGGAKFTCRSNNYYGNTVNGAAAQIDTWYCVETLNLQSGTQRWWINGVEQPTVGYGAVAMDRVKVGFIHASGSTSTTIQIDCVVVADAYIGPEEEGGEAYAFELSETCAVTASLATQKNLYRSTFETVEVTSIIETQKTITLTMFAEISQEIVVSGVLETVKHISATLIELTGTLNLSALLVELLPYVTLSTDELLGLVVVFFVIGLACSIALVVALRKK